MNGCNPVVKKWIIVQEIFCFHAVTRRCIDKNMKDKSEKQEIIISSAKDLTRRSAVLIKRGLEDLIIFQDRRKLEQKSIRIVIVDDVLETRENIRKLLQFESDIEVVGEAETSDQGIKLYGELRPDILLTDINHLDTNSMTSSPEGITMTKQICENFSDAKVLILSVHGNSLTNVRKAITAGARGSLSKPPLGADLISAIRLIAHCSATEPFFFFDKKTYESTYELAGDFLPSESVSKLFGLSKIPFGPLMQIYWRFHDRPIEDSFVAVEQFEFVSNKIEDIDFSLTKLSNRGMSYLCNMKLEHIKSINITGTNVTDIGLSELKRIRKLEELSFSSTRITNAGLSLISGIKSLRTLNLSNTQIDDEGCKFLGGFGLSELILSNTRVRGKGLRYLWRNPNLYWLDLSSTAIEDEELIHIRGLRNLKRLNLRNTQISNKGLEHLRWITGLESLVVRGTRVTPQGIKNLESSLPNIRYIIW